MIGEFFVRATYEDRYPTTFQFFVMAKNFKEANSLARKKIRQMMGVRRLTRHKYCATLYNEGGEEKIWEMR